MRGFRRIILIFSLAGFLIFISGNFIFAQKGLEVQYPEIGGIRPEDTTIPLPNFVKYIFNFFIGIAGLITFSLLVSAGVRYLTSAGNPATMRDAQKQIFAAIFGLFILLGSFLLLTTINPQLVLLKIPERLTFALEFISEFKLKGETLAFTGIPAGGLIEELFTKERLEKIKVIAEETKKQAEIVKKLSQELKTLTGECSCENCDHGWCDPGSCGGNCECVSHCQCVGSPRESNDPCPNRAAIDQKREELKKAFSEKEADKGLKYWQKKLDREINGSSEEKEKYIGFRKVYEDLILAETLIKSCSLSPSEYGKPQIVLGYNAFLEYQKYLKDVYKVEKFEREYPFSYISQQTPYYLATFFCGELLYSVSPIQFDEEYLLKIREELTGTLKQPEVMCEQEISIGETVDNAEELARRILAELDNINNNIINEIKTAETLSDLPEQCDCKNCNSSMETSEECCEWEECNCSVECEQEDRDWWDFPWDPWDIIHWLKPPVVYAACWLECDTCCVYSCCTYCKCQCSGSPCPVQEINNAVSQIEQNYNEIDKSNLNLKNLIEEKGLENKLKISEIFKNLAISQKQLGLCFNSKTIQMMAEEGKEKVPWKELYSCSAVKESNQAGFPFYNESKREISECYGSSSENSDFMDNFFCCETEILPR